VIVNPPARNIPWLFWNVKINAVKGIDHYWHDMRNRAGLSQVPLHDLRLSQYGGTNGFTASAERLRFVERRLPAIA
jgi:hypothetical protein